MSHISNHPLTASQYRDAGPPPQTQHKGTVRYGDDENAPKFGDVRAELLQLARVVTCDVAVRGPGARLARAGRLEISGRGGARERDGNPPALPA